MTLFEIITNSKFRALSANILFHFVVLGFAVRLIFHPDMPDEHWIGLLILIFTMNPILQYFFGWDMHFKHPVAAADAPKHVRFLWFLFFVFSYTFLFLVWLGVIGHSYQ